MKQTIDRIDTYIEQQRHRLHIPGVSLAIVAGDQVMHLRGFGQAHPGGGVPSPQTPFFIGSLTKSFTALAIMQLVEAGKIELDASVQRYLPWFRVADPQASAQMTVRHLLNQTSGLPTSSGEISLADFDNRPDATRRQACALSSIALTRPVGSAFEYSNANYNLLGLIIEAVNGATYADYLQRRIFAPLDMNHTYTSRDLAQQNGLAMGHQYWFTIPVAVPHMPIPQGSLPGGMLISSAEDMAHYLIALLNGGRYKNGQILSSTGVAELQRGVGEVRAMGHVLGQYGMGWFIAEISQSKLVWHGGTLPDFAAYMALLPEQKKGVILLFNTSHHWLTPVLAEVGMGVTALLAEEEYTPLPFVRLIPWMLRGQALIPAIQATTVVASMRLLRRWRQQPERRSEGYKWGLCVLLMLIPHLLITLTLRPMLGKRRDYLKLYMPDYAWIAMICGSFSLVWSFLHLGLIFQGLRKSPGYPASLPGSKRCATFRRIKGDHNCYSRGKPLC